MFLTERQQQIVAQLRQCKKATLQQLIDVTNASESTVRRDLTELERQHIVERVHGGAILKAPTLFEKSLPEKTTEAFGEKLRIMQHAATLIQYRDCIYIDAGSTTAHLIPHLVDKHVTVVTNGVMHVPALLEHGIETILVGGHVKTNTQAVIGAIAQQQLRGYYFDCAFIGANGFSIDGYTTADVEEAAIKQLVLQQAKRVYVVADDSKYGLRQFAKFAELSEAVLITTNLTETQQQALQYETEVINA